VVTQYGIQLLVFWIGRLQPKQTQSVEVSTRIGLDVLIQKNYSSTLQKHMQCYKSNAYSLDWMYSSKTTTSQHCKDICNTMKTTLPVWIGRFHSHKLQKQLCCVWTGRCHPNVATHELWSFVYWIGRSHP
jgi:hypothetical protein